MREIKFRAWDKDGQEMIGANDFYQKSDPNQKGNGLHLSDFFGVNKDGAVGKEKENIVFMQYTGLKDKNGEEIYEGDVLSLPNNENKFVVEWVSSRTMNGWNVNKNSGWEVIGNIYENPELLK